MPRTDRLTLLPGRGPAPGPFLGAATDPLPLLMGRPGSWAMVVGRPEHDSGDGRPSPEAVEATWYLRAKAKIIEAIGRAGGDPRNRRGRQRHEARQAAGEAGLLLRPDRAPWQPEGGWAHGWAQDLPWYRPEDGDTGLPVAPPGPVRLPDFAAAPPPPAARPWPDPPFLRFAGPRHRGPGRHHRGGDRAG